LLLDLLHEKCAQSNVVRLIRYGPTVRSFDGALAPTTLTAEILNPQLVPIGHVGDVNCTLPMAAHVAPPSSVRSPV
jgi:hypothetical protein